MTALSILGLLPQTATVTGSARFEGIELLDAPAAHLRDVRGQRISFVFQEPMTSLNPVLRVGQQVAEVVRRHNDVSRGEARARAVELFDLVHIPDPERRVDEYPHQLSGGMRQRVMIAMALSCDPSVLIADEPTTALDVTIQAGILDLLRELRERLGGDRADHAQPRRGRGHRRPRDGHVRGRKVEEAPVGELFAHPQHPYTIGLLGAIPRPGAGRNGRRLQEIPGRVPSLHELDLLPFADRCPRADELSRSEVPELRPVGPTTSSPASIRARSGR